MTLRTLLLGLAALTILGVVAAVSFVAIRPKVDFDAISGQLAVIVESNQPAAVRDKPEAPNAYSKLMEIAGTTAQVHADLALETTPEAIDFFALITPERHHTEAMIRDARLALDAYAQRGIFEQLQDLSHTPRAARPVPAASIRDFMLSNSGSHARNLFRALRVRMHEQVAARDFMGAARSYESCLALVRVIETQGTYLDLLVARGIHASADYFLRKELVSNAFDESSLAAAAEAVTRQTSNRPPASRFLEVEHLFGLESLRESTALGRAIQLPRLTRFFDAAIRIADANRGDRTTDPELIQLVQYIVDENPRRGSNKMPAALQLIWTYDVGTTDTNGTLIMIALERHRLATGTYPDSLEALPQAAALAAASPWPLIYRRTEDGYTLYAAGHDGTDDGGAPHPEVEVQALLPGNPGTDYVVH